MSLLSFIKTIPGENSNPGAGEPNNPVSESVSKPGEEVTSNFMNTDATAQTGGGGGYHVEDLDPQPQHLVEDILNEKPLLNKLQTDTEQEYMANNQGSLLPPPPQTAPDMYLNHNSMTSELVEPAKYSLESIKRSRIAHKLINLMNNRTSSDLLTQSRVRSIKRDTSNEIKIHKNNNNDVLNKKAKVKLKRALLKHLRKMSHKSVKK